MERTLTQEEIDSLLSVASGKQDENQKEETRSIKPCTFRQSGQLNDEHMAAIKGLHEGFARNLSQSLAAYLRVSFEVSLGSIEQLSYSQVLEGIPEVTYMMCFRVDQMSATGALQIDHSLVFPLIDILLGGVGHCEILTREVSEIEEHVMDGVSRIICQELEAAWTALAAHLLLDGRQPQAQMQRLLPPTEKILCMSFEIKMAEINGTLKVIVPVSISNTLLRKLSMDASYGKPRPADAAREQITAKMLDCSCPVGLGLTPITLPIETVVRLAPQSVCNLGIPVRKPASFAIAGREAFDATPVRHGRLRAAQLGQSIPFAAEERKQ